MRSSAENVRAEADAIAQEIYSDQDCWRTQGPGNVAKGFTDFDKQHRGHAIAELLAAYARLTSAHCQDHHRDAADVPNALKFHNVLDRFESAHRTYLVPDSREAKIHQQLTGGAKRWTLEGSLGNAIDNAHAAVAYQALLTAAHTENEDWMQQASRAYADPVAFSRYTGYMTASLFLLYCRPNQFEGTI